MAQRGSDILGIAAGDRARGRGAGAPEATGLGSLRAASPCAAATAAAAALAALAAAAAASCAFAADAPLMLVVGSLALKLGPRLIALGAASARAGGRQGCHAPVARRAASRLEERKEARPGDAGVGRCGGSLICTTSTPGCRSSKEFPGAMGGVNQHEGLMKGIR